MLAELEQELIAAVNASSIANKLKDVAAMPDGDAETLVKRFAAAAPGVYAVAGDINFDDDTAALYFNLICCTRNARGNDAARHGDAQTIGLYQIIDALTYEFNSLRTASAVWHAKSVAFGKGKVWAANGLSVASIRLDTKVTRIPVDESLLGDFITFHADYDIDPFQPHSEHLKWAAEPPDLTDSQPELTDTMILPQ